MHLLSASCRWKGSDDVMRLLVEGCRASLSLGNYDENLCIDKGRVSIIFCFKARVPLRTPVTVEWLLRIG